MIRDLDEVIDQLRDKTIEPLTSISESLAEETMEVLADEEKIRVVDGKIDAARDLAVEPLGKIVALLNSEMAESDEQFDTTRTETISIFIIISVIGTIIAILAAFLITVR